MSFELSQLGTSSTDVLSKNSLAPVLDEGSLTTSLTGLGRSNQSLLFVDKSVTDYQQLLAGVTPGTEIHVLDPGQDGVTQITNTLLGRQNITSLHIVSHGEAGGVDFGSSALNLIDLPEYAAQLKTWSKALTNDADILFYGCNIAEGQLGQTFVQNISQITGADVAASDDLTGNSSLGGDWNLEVATGAIETSPIFSTDVLNSYKGTLVYTLGARHSVSSGDVFLGGEFIELGVRGNAGFFGTAASKPADFFGTSARSNIGLSIDPDGYQTGSTFSYDVFLPGTPYEGWSIGYQQSGTTYSLENAGGNTPTIQIASTTTADTSAGNILAATVTSNTTQNVSVVQTYSFDYTQDYWKTAVTITNNSATAINNLRYARAYDPDNGKDASGGGYTTTNTIVNTIAADGKVILSAQVPSSDLSFSIYGARPSYFISFDPSARASIGGSIGSTVANSLLVGTKGQTVTSDTAIALWFDIGTLAAGASKTVQFYTGLSTNILAAAANAPTNTVPGTQSTNAGTPITLGGSNAISVADSDSTNLTVTLTATNGTTSLSGVTGLSFASGDGTTDSTMTFSGTKTDINTALNNLVFNPTAGFSGAASIQIETSDGDFSDADTVNITVIKDVPTLTVGATSLNYTENAAAGLVAPNLAVTGSDGIDGARVSIGTNFDINDRLGIAGQSGTSGTINGLTWSYNTTTGILSLVGAGSAATYQGALRQVTYSNISENPTTGDRAIQFALGTNLANPDNGHFYEFVNAGSPISWTAARDAAAARNYFGLQGYLVTVTSAAESSFVSSKLQGEGWLGASDAAVENEWRWVTGPETGQQFWQGLGTTGSPVSGRYNNWNSEEPNNSGDEDYGQFLLDGKWNDLSNNPGSISGYVVEYGGLAGDPALQVTGNATVTVTAVNDAPTISTNSLNISEGGSVVLSSSNINATDPDNTPAQLTYTASGISGG
ncbi:MAG: DUF4347 domain-containing protein, partial [Nostoc sp.]|uniref:DUF4347 domain-containing protein n=1 Tax=Nostoc sp. TaxID=1180 RepID=UPI002FF9A2DF